MTDREILEIYKSEGGKDQAFNLIVREYSQRLYWHLRGLVFSHDDADDLLQNTFMKAWNALPGFRAESGLYTWLYRIATNEAFTFLKKERFNNKFSLTPYETKLANRIADDPYFRGDTIQMLLQQEVAKLPDRQRAIFSMRYFHEMEYAQIAEILDSNPDAVKASYSLAYRKIEKNLKELG
ncbi:MAG: RNA polymerase sigma factor [Bacteroidales bacterium]|jgi:RNA polymerase sigma-70 factor (ECF subfamily)|nr:RNA polymerase sigma factor [Bacteroidales bacterium]MBQ1886403.1 RNA polymerase sigma factor [Bacteroidales bacterium]MBR2135594.1 RNA polymerase sigma factor [Bacteroidales bacterium]